ncbi:MAG: Tetratricopeptide repeat protein [Acidobacteria bacterium]|nr:Tetratricopeptide repeat protein [Acidobacteriota bacterium]
MNCFSNRYRQIYAQNISFILAFFFLLFSFTTIALAQEDADERENPVIIFNLGQEAHEKGDLNEALKFYDQALKIAPDFPEAEYQRGSAFLSLGKTDEAEKAFRRAVQLRADWSLAAAKLGEVLVRKHVLSLKNADAEKIKQSFAETSNVLKKAIELDAGNFPAHVALADLQLSSAAQPDVLKETLVRVRKISDGKMNVPASVWAARAALENALGEKASAKTSVNRALEIDPKNVNALFERAEIALAEGDTNQAAGIVKTITQLSPAYPNINLFQARIYASSGKPDEALKIRDAEKNLSPAAVSLREKIIASNSVNASELEKQLEKDAKNAFVLGRLCTLLRAENPVKAIEYCRRASEAEPANITHAVGFGAALVQAKRYEEAVNLFRKLAEFAPENFTVRANYATALFQLKKFPEAKAEYLWLTEKQPNLAVAFYFLGITHDQLGEYLDAMANYQQFLRLADQDQNKLEIEKVNLRLPVLQKLIKDKKGKKNV